MVEGGSSTTTSSWLAPQLTLWVPGEVDSSARAAWAVHDACVAACPAAYAVGSNRYPLFGVGKTCCCRCALGVQTDINAPFR